MLKWLESRVLWGLLLIVAGVVFLLQNLFQFEIGAIFWGALFALAGLFFITIYINHRPNWWALIPGFTLLGIAATIFTSSYLPMLDNIFGGVFVLGGIGTAFVAVYLADRRHWWAIIPAGVMYSLTTIVIFDNLLGGFGSGGILFIGLGITFVILAILPTNERSMTWAWYPAIPMMIMGVLIFAASEDLFRFVLPAALIAGGLLLVFRAFVPRRS